MKDDTLYFAACLLVREQRQGTSPIELSPILDPTQGSSIYDPQAFGSEYLQVTCPGRCTLFFPSYLKPADKGVLTIEWQAKSLRLQVDRKFASLACGSIKSLELTEIAPADAGTNYFS